MFGIEFSEAGLINFFAPFAYEPTQVYIFVCCFMLAASFGLPIPEELTLISVGLVANMAQHPDLYPPPYPGAEGVNTITLCFVSFFAVIFSDLIVFLIGKIFGAKIIKTKFFQKQFAGAGFDKINTWFQKFGRWDQIRLMLKDLLMFNLAFFHFIFLRNPKIFHRSIF